MREGEREGMFLFVAVRGEESQEIVVVVMMTARKIREERRREGRKMKRGRCMCVFSVRR